MAAGMAVHVLRKCGRQRNHSASLQWQSTGPKAADLAEIHRRTAT